MGDIEGTKILKFTKTSIMVSYLLGLSPSPPISRLRVSVTAFLRLSNYTIACVLSSGDYTLAGRGSVDSELPRDQVTRAH